VIWDARPWAPEAAAEREALGLLDHLFTKPLCRADVLEYLRRSPTVRPPVRGRKRGTFPVNISLNEVSDKVRIARGIMRKYPEVETIVTQVGRPDDGTDPTGFYNTEYFVPLRPE
jgi:hypothetical protein